MSRYSDSDPYLDSATGVLKNRVDIVEQNILEQIEADLVATRSYELSLSPIEGNFDLTHLRAIHRYLFSDMYEWAGELRTVDISKGGNRFAHYAHMEDAAETIFMRLGNEKFLKGLGLDAFSDRAAYYLAELNALHPFREGNGRVQREFVSHLAAANGYYIAWENIGQKNMHDAAIQSFSGDTSKLSAFIRNNISAERD